MLLLLAALNSLRCKRKKMNRSGGNILGDPVSILLDLDRSHSRPYLAAFAKILDDFGISDKASD